MRVSYDELIRWSKSPRQQLAQLTTVPSVLVENEKVRVATGAHLPKLAQKLSQLCGKKFKVDSFILLRDSSPMGRLQAQTPTPDELKMVDQMKAKHVLRLDWHEQNERGSKQSAYWDGMTYLDMMFEVLKLEDLCGWLAIQLNIDSVGIFLSAMGGKTNLGLGRKGVVGDSLMMDAVLPLILSLLRHRRSCGRRTS